MSSRKTQTASLNVPPAVICAAHDNVCKSGCGSSVIVSIEVDKVAKNVCVVAYRCPMGKKFSLSLAFPADLIGTLSVIERTGDDPCIKIVPAKPLVGIEPNPGPNKTLGASPVDFALHGNYVGPGHTGGQKLGEINFSTKPVDQLDDAARSHDFTYTVTNDSNRRAISDYELAKRAFAAKVGGYAKLKALAVGAGMSLKGYITGNAMHALDRRLELVPPHGTHTKYDTVQPKMKSSIKRNPKVDHGIMRLDSQKPRLIGIEPNPGPNKGKPSKAERKAQSKRDKAKKKSVQPSGPAPAKKSNKPVNTNMIPNQLINRVSIKPGTRIISAGRDSMIVEATISLGSLNPGSAATSGGLYVPNQVIMSVLVDHALFAGSEMDLYLNAYEFGHLLSSSLSYVTGLSSTTAGLLYFYGDPDATDQLPILTTLNPNTIASHRRPEERTIWQSLDSLPLLLNKGKIWLDPNVASLSTGQSTTGSTDVRLGACGTVNVILGSAIPSTTTIFGEVWLTARFKLQSPQRSELSSLVYSGRVMSTTANSGVGLATGTSYDLSGLISVLIRSSSVTATGEAIWQPKFLQPSSATGAQMALKLPIGDYLIYGAAYLVTTGSITAVSCQPLLGSTVTASYDRHDSVEGSIPANIEVSTGVVATNGSVNSLVRFSNRLRIVQTLGTNALGLINQNFFLTFTGNATLAGATLQVLRIPSFDANPVAAYFPFGNAGTLIGYSARESALLSLFESGDQDEKKLATMALFKLQAMKPEDMKRYPKVYDYLMPLLYSAISKMADHELKVPDSLPDTPIKVEQEDEKQDLSRSIHLPSSSPFASLVTALSKVR